VFSRFLTISLPYPLLLQLTLTDEQDERYNDILDDYDVTPLSVDIVVHVRPDETVALAQNGKILATDLVRYLAPTQGKLKNTAIFKYIPKWSKAVLAANKALQKLIAKGDADSESDSSDSESDEEDDKGEESE
jgi:hypothetical protein